MLLSKFDEAAKLTARFVTLLDNVYQFVVVITWLDIRNRKLSGGFQDWLRRGMIRSYQLCADHWNFESRSTNCCHSFWKINGYPLRFDMSIGSNCQINSAKTCLLRILPELAPIQLWNRF